METFERYQWRHSSVFNVNREHISCFVLIVEFEQENVSGFMLKWQTLLETRSSILRVMLQYFQCEQNVVTNSIWVYTITTLRVNQWKIFEEFTSNDDSG